MDVRGKLVELVKRAITDWKHGDVSEMIADHLIANGVTVQENVKISDEFLKQLKNAPIMICKSEPSIVTVQEWIPVKDRLPGKEEYTATTEYGTEYYIRLLIAYKTDTVEYEIGYYDGYKWMTETPIRLIKDVVAWMPFPNMPQPPKGE